MVITTIYSIAFIVPKRVSCRIMKASTVDKTPLSSTNWFNFKDLDNPYHVIDNLLLERGSSESVTHITLPQCVMIEMGSFIHGNIYGYKEVKIAASGNDEEIEDQGAKDGIIYNFNINVLH